MPVSAQAVKPVYALVGDDNFLQLQALQEVLRRLPKGADRIDLDGDRAELAQVLDELRSFAMFGGAKVVVVRQADEFISRYREQMEAYVAHPSDSGVLVLRLNSLPSNQRIYKAIQKTGQIVPCAPPKEKDLPAWVLNRAKEGHGLVLTIDAANLLADLIGAELGRLDSELSKLALQHEGGGKVGPEQIAAAVSFQREQEMWHMTDELTAGRPEQALRRWRQLVRLDPSSEFRAVTWLTIWLEKLQKAADMRRQRMQPFVIAKELRIWPASNVDSLLKVADRMGESGIRRAVDLLAEIDKRTKSGLGEAAENVERFILSLGR